MNYPLLNHIITVLFLVLVISVIFRYLRLPQVLGYLVVGTLVGPHGLAWVPNVEDAHRLAGFGVVFLMFTVGLEFSLPKMFALHRAVVYLGGLEVLICSTFGMLIGLLLGLNWGVGLVIGGILGMSSTAIAAKQLSDQLELNHTHGQNALGVLLFQDLAVIPFFILIGALGVASKNPISHYVLFMTMIKGSAATLIILAMGKWVFRPLFHVIAETHIIELFTLTVLLVTLASAWLTENLGLSFALGAFLAGMMLSETQFRHQIEVEIRPFRDVLLGLFFITIGMLLNLSSWHTYWWSILLLFLGMTISKIIIITLLSYWLGNDKVISFRTSLVLAQGGEFGFAMLTLALTNKLFPPGYGQIILGALLLSFAFAPLLISSNQKIADKLFPKSLELSADDTTQSIKPAGNSLKRHVILCGFGRIGQNIGSLLDQQKIPYLALDLDPDHVRDAGIAGKPVTYGDASHPGILEAAAVKSAKALVICFNDPRAAVKILHYLETNRIKIPIVVRCKDEAELSQLQGHGASQIVVETHEESIALIYCLLRFLRMSHAKINHLIQNIRKEHYNVLHQVFPGSFTEEANEEGRALKQLRPIILFKETDAVNRNLGEMLSQLAQVEVIAIRRGKEYHPHPPKNFRLRPHDVLILYATPENLEKAENIFFALPGKYPTAHD